MPSSHPPLSRLLLSLTTLLLPVALLATSWLYYYPAVHGCGFPSPLSENAGKNGREAPFRLLALGDPQLEGSSSLPGGGVGWEEFLERVGGKWRNLGIKKTDKVQMYGEGDEKGEKKDDDTENDNENNGDEDDITDAWTPKFRPEWLATWVEFARLDVAFLRAVLIEDIPLLIQTYRKRLDLWGNDYYLAHIVRTMRRWSKPTHIAVMGDLLGSQWISDEEFERRAGRYWGRVFAGLEKVRDGIIDKGTEWWEEAELKKEEEKRAERRWKPSGPRTEVLGEDPQWESRVINVVGNHDIGYAGDLDEKRVERFEKAFGRVNWEIVFQLPKEYLASNSSEAKIFSKDEDGDAINSSFLSTKDKDSDIPSLHLVILNSMNLDTPAYSDVLQSETYDFLNHVISSSPDPGSRRARTQAMLLLTHIPLHKESGICVDDPFFDFFDNGAGVKEQNMLSEYVSEIVKEGIFGLTGEEPGKLKKKGLLLNGHDHAGCDVLHYWQPPLSNTDTDSSTSTSPPVVTETTTEKSTESQVPAQESHGLSQQQPNSEPSPEESKGSAESETSISMDEQQDFPDIPSPWHAHRLPSSPSTPRSPLTPLTQPLPSSLNTSSLRSTPHLREVTLRSMMGEYGGGAGLVSAWWDPDNGEGEDGEKGEWRFEVSYCRLGVQHLWWGVHGLDGVVVLIAVLGFVSLFLEKLMGRRESGKGKANKGMKKKSEGGVKGVVKVGEKGKK